MTRQYYDVVVVDKTHREEGWIFKDVVYYVVFRFVVSGLAVERCVPLQQYYNLAVGDSIKIAMYSKDGRAWFFSEEEARL